LGAQVKPTPEAGGKVPWRRWLAPAFLVLAMASAALFLSLGEETPAMADVSYSFFYRQLEEGHVKRVSLRERTLSGELSPPQTSEERTIERFRTHLPQEDPGLLPLLRAKGVEIEVGEESTALGNTLIFLLPWVLVIGAWWWMWRRARRALGAEGGPLGGMIKPGKAARFEAQDQVDVRFHDVAGLTGAKRDLREVIDFFRDPERFQRIGGRMPRGVLLVGGPGTGKTLLARAVAGEAHVPFFSISGSEFIELYVGVGAARVRELFSAAKAAAPAIVFIDEIDAVGRSRGTGLGGGHDEREQTLNQLLAEMDGFARHEQIVVMAATNRPDVLDPALLRPGRFDRRIVLDLPASEARRAILAVHTRDKPLEGDVSLEALARATPGFSGADLANLVNEAALGAIRRGADRISAGDFSAAQDKVTLGDPRETRLTPEEKQRVAVHEAGHAVCAHLSGGEPLRRVSILPRGMSLGATQRAPLGDRHLYTQSELEAKLQVLLGGYAAERLLLGEGSTGAENDLRQATELAQRMIGELGMSERIGPVFHEHHAEHPFLGARIATDSGVSDATIHEIEAEARELLMNAQAAATALLASERPLLDQVVAALLEHETLDEPELTRLLSSHAPRAHPEHAHGPVHAT
jgi:cell division protease FtsH